MPGNGLIGPDAWSAVHDICGDQHDEIMIMSCHSEQIVSLP